MSEPARHLVGGATAPRDHFDALDSLRGICATLVALHHVCLFTNAEIWQRASFVRNAYLFVDFFFVLSGFVVCHAYGTRITSGLTWLQFMVKRFGRLWPLHIALLGAMFAFILAIQFFPHPSFMKLILGKGPGFSVSKALFSGLFLSAHGVEMGWNAPSWSISAEFSTYALFGAVCLLGRRWLVPASLALTAGGIFLLAKFSPNYIGATANLGLARCAAGFFTGVLVYLLYRKIAARAAAPRAAFTAVEVASIAAAIAFVAFVAPGPFDPGPASLAAPFVFAVPVLIIAIGRGSVSNFLVRDEFLAMGRWSYSIYMLHWPIFTFFCYIAFVCSVALGHGDPFIYSTTSYPEHRLILPSPLIADVAAFAFCAVTIAAASVTYSRIEVPWRDYFANVARGLQRQAPKQATAAAGE